MGSSNDQIDTARCIKPAIIKGPLPDSEQPLAALLNAALQEGRRSLDLIRSIFVEGRHRCFQGLVRISGRLIIVARKDRDPAQSPMGQAESAVIPSLAARFDQFCEPAARITVQAAGEIVPGDGKIGPVETIIVRRVLTIGNKLGA